MHVSICIHLYMYTCPYLSMYLCIFAHRKLRDTAAAVVLMTPRVRLYIHIYMYIGPNVHIYLCIYVSMYVCIYVSMYLCIYVSMYLRPPQATRHCDGGRADDAPRTYIYV